MVWKILCSIWKSNDYSVAVVKEKTLGFLQTLSIDTSIKISHHPFNSSFYYYVVQAHIANMDKSMHHALCSLQNWWCMSADNAWRKKVERMMKQWYGVCSISVLYWLWRRQLGRRWRYLCAEFVQYLCSICVQCTLYIICVQYLCSISV